MSELANRGPQGSPSSTIDGRTPAEIEQDLAIDSLVDLELIHSGRSASLFQAFQLPTQRTVAVKVLHDELSSDTGQRFDRERAITAQLSGHTGIVPLFATGTTADDEPYLVMPFYRRGSLADLMNRYGPLGWREATFLLDPVAVTLAEVHSRRLVHRNLKPGNILLTDFLLPRVADFGMCLPIGDVSTDATLIEASGFRAPETAEAGPSDPRIDVFGLGASLLGLVSGRPPLTTTDTSDRRTAFSRPDGGIDVQAVPPPSHRGQASPPRVVPDSIIDLIQRSMAVDPADRPSDAAAFVTELRRCVNQADGPTATPSRVSNRVGTAEPVSLGPDAVVDATRAAGRSELKPAPAAELEPGEPSAGSGAPPAAEKRASDHDGDGPRDELAANRARTDFYVLLLASIITVGILTMVAAAFLTGN